MKTSTLLISLLMFLCSCTYSINLIHRKGIASDLIDEKQPATADVKPNLTMPAT